MIPPKTRAGVTRTIELDGLSAEYRDAVVDGIGEMMEKYPNVGDRITRIGTYDGIGNKRPRGHEATAFRPTWRRSLLSDAPSERAGGRIGLRDMSSERMKRQSDSGHWVGGGELRTLPIHEFGHHAQFTYEGMMGRAGTLGEVRQRNDVIKDLVVKACSDTYGTRGFGAKARARLAEDVSKYGASEPQEAFAEAWADFHIRGDAAAEVSKRIVQPVVDWITDDDLVRRLAQPVAEVT